jgi:hypothetical protein
VEPQLITEAFADYFLSGFNFACPVFILGNFDVTFSDFLNVPYILDADFKKAI